MNQKELADRTKAFALRAMRLVAALPKRMEAGVVGKQLVRSATSVGADYRSACRGRSKAEFLAKLGIALEEADESVYWLELIMDGKLMAQEKVAALHKEADELTAILAASLKTAKGKR